MAGKSNIRSMRFSDEIIKIIEAQPGETFTAKFENLVHKCVRELPEQEKHLKLVEKQIKEESQRLEEIRQKKWKVEQYTRNLEYELQRATQALKRLTDPVDKENK